MRHLLTLHSFASSILETSPKLCSWDKITTMREMSFLIYPTFNWDLF